MSQKPVSRPTRLSPMRLTRIRLFGMPRLPIALAPTDARDPRFERWHTQWPVGTYPEFRVYQTLEDMGYKQGEDFIFQYPIAGGRQESGGAVADFLLLFTAPQIVIRVQTVYFHLQAGMDVKAYDALSRIIIEDEGFMVVDVHEDDCVQRPRVTVEAAIRGEELRVFT